MYIYDKDEIKKNLTIDQVKDLVDELGGEAIDCIAAQFVTVGIVINYIIMIILNYLSVLQIAERLLIFFNLFKK